MAVPYTFGTATASIPLSQLDSNFATVITLGNTAIQLGNTVTTLNNMTLANVTISSGNVTITNVAITTANVTTANITTAVIGTETVTTSTITTANVTTANITTDNITNGTVITSLTLSYGTANGVAYLNGSKVLTTGSALTFDGTTVSLNASAANFKVGAAGDTSQHYFRNIDNAGSGFYFGIDNSSGSFFNAGAYGRSIYSEGNYPINFVVNSAEQMRLTSTGLGIGTSSIGAKLQVSSGATALAAYISSTATPAYSATSYNGANALLNLVSGGASGAFNGMRLSQGGSSELLFGVVQEAGGAGAFVWQGYNGSTYAERARIDSSGNLLVGQTSSGAVNSNSWSFTQSAAGQLVGNHASGSASGSIYIGFYYNTTGIGSITQNGTTAVAYNTSSDYRLKEDIQPMTGALAFVRKQRPVKYRWKADGSEGSGYIAHWMQEDGAGQCVTGEKDAVDAEGKPQYQGIDTSFMVGPLNAAIKELADIVDAQAALILELKARLDAVNF